MALSTKFIKICRKRTGSPLTKVGTSGSIKEINSRPLACALPAASSRTSSTAALRSKSMFSSSSFFASILKNQNVVNDLRKHFARTLNNIGAFALLSCEIRVEQKSGRSDHSVERRANLMRHICQKLAFRLRVVVFYFFRLFKLFDSFRQFAVSFADFSLQRLISLLQSCGAVTHCGKNQNRRPENMKKIRPPSLPESRIYSENISCGLSNIPGVIFSPNFEFITYSGTRKIFFVIVYPCERSFRVQRAEFDTEFLARG